MARERASSRGGDSRKGGFLGKGSKKDHFALPKESEGSLGQERQLSTRTSPGRAWGDGAGDPWGRLLMYTPFQQPLKPHLLLEMGLAFLREWWPLTFLDFPVNSFQMNPVFSGHHYESRSRQVHRVQQFNREVTQDQSRKTIRCSAAFPMMAFSFSHLVLW